MKISTKTRYGLRALVYLSKIKKRVSLKEISEKEGITVDYLQKIFLKLQKFQIVEGKKGIGGGYLLRCRPSDLKLKKVIEILEDETSLIKCLSSKKKYLCPRKKICSTRYFWEKIQKSFDDSLNSLTLKDLTCLKR